ncbi:MAG: hypothetical protein FVQ78_02275 [Solirubrobacterales bacterium]|nr:hypothetical protein [Solirubrobacterales bacterium]
MVIYIASLSVAEWTAIGSSVIGLSALGLAIYSIWHQRALPFLEAQVIHDVATGAAAVAVRNNGTRSARAPWVMFAAKDGSMFFCNHAGPGFLAPGEGRYVLTTAAAPTGEAEGVVGHIDRRGKHVVRPMAGGRSRRFRKGGRSFLDMFKAFYPDMPLGDQAGLRADRTLK